MTIKLPRLSSASPIVTSGGAAAITLVQWWNTVCDAVEGALNSIEANQAAIDGALGIAQGAQANSAANAAVLKEIAQSVAAAGTVTSVVAGAGLLGGTITTTGTISLNLDSFSSTQGAILFRGAAGWQALGPGTAGQKLQTNGAGANPTWA